MYVAVIWSSNFAVTVLRIRPRHWLFKHASHSACLNDGVISSSANYKSYCSMPSNIYVYTWPTGMAATPRYYKSGCQSTPPAFICTNYSKIPALKSDLHGVRCYCNRKSFEGSADRNYILKTALSTEDYWLTSVVMEYFSVLTTASRRKFAYICIITLAKIPCVNWRSCF